MGGIDVFIFQLFVHRRWPRQLAPGEVPVREPLRADTGEISLSHRVLYESYVPYPDKPPCQALRVMSVPLQARSDRTETTTTNIAGWRPTARCWQLPAYVTQHALRLFPG